MASQAIYEQEKALHEFRERLAHVGILIGTLGLILALIGIFPSITGVEAQTGIGVLQILIVFAWVIIADYRGINFCQSYLLSCYKP